MKDILRKSPIERLCMSVSITPQEMALAHVMTDLATQLNDEQAEIVYCWLSKVLTIVDMARIDAEGSA